LKVITIIPVYGRQEYTHDLMGDLDREGAEVLIVDNGGDYETCSKEKVIRPGSNLGWGVGCNYGLSEAEKSDAEAFLILNNDTRLCIGFMERLEAPLDVEVGLSGPNPDISRQKSRKYISPVTKKLLANPPENEIRRVGSLDGCCILIPRLILEKVGKLDTEPFGFYGYGADVDFCIRVKMAGFPVFAAMGAILWHQHHATGSLLEENRGRYRAKASRSGWLGLVKKYGLRWRRKSRSIMLKKS